ncbi:hypothetical protein CDV36_010198 [Fusarium kuroshium]|uniref:Uncharacterized protein n=1 Tax=Fusarium kuroshium TaxID=2010991 RepID=A0A3M2RY13_9HYPO|nr:hypothetical protein CDV36_010198 [Fusarium kuroshium]
MFAMRFTLGRERKGFESLHKYHTWSLVQLGSSLGIQTLAYLSSSNTFVNNHFFIHFIRSTPPLFTAILTMCHKKTAFFTACAHSMKLDTAKCENFWKSKLAKGVCIVTREAELVRGWCAECEAVFRADGIASTVGKDFDPRSPDFISRYWAFKSQAGWIHPVDAKLFPRNLVECKGEIDCIRINGTRYELYILRRAIDAFGASRICIEKRFSCIAPGPADFPAIIEKACRLTLEWGMPERVDGPSFPKISDFPAPNKKASERIE